MASLAQIVAVFKDFFGGVFFGVIWQKCGVFKFEPLATLIISFFAKNLAARCDREIAPERKLLGRVMRI